MLLKSWATPPAIRPEGFHFLGLHQLGLKLFPFGDVLAGTQVSDNFSRFVLDDAVVPGDEPFFPALGQYGIFEKLHRLDFPAQQLLGNGSDYLGNPFRNEFLKPVLAQHLGFLIAQDFATLPVDQGHYSPGIDGHHYRGHDVEIGLRPFLFTDQCLFGPLALGDILNRTVGLLERAVVPVLDLAVNRGGHSRSVFSDHPKLDSTDEALAFELGEVVLEVFVEVREQELRKIAAEYFFPGVPEVFAIGFVDADQFTLGVERLVTHGRIFEQGPEALLTLLKGHLDQFVFGQGLFKLGNTFLQFGVLAADFRPVILVGHACYPPWIRHLQPPCISTRRRAVHIDTA